MTELQTALTIAGGIITVLLFLGGIIRYLRHIERQSVREHQKNLRQRFRQVLREIENTCRIQSIHGHDVLPEVARSFEEAGYEIRAIREDGLISPSEKHLRQLERLLGDFAHRYDAMGQLPNFGIVPGVDVPALLQANRKRMDERFEQVESRTKVYIRAIGRMDRGLTRTYWRYKVLWPPFISGV